MQKIHLRSFFMISLLATSRTGIPQADLHGKAHDNSSLAAAPVAHGW